MSVNPEQQIIAAQVAEGDLAPPGTVRDPIEHLPAGYRC
jgi:hypothetical protein